MSQPPSSNLALYDLTVRRLHAALAGRLPSAADLLGTATAYAYWVCMGASKPGADWDQILNEYIDDALRNAAAEWESVCREAGALRRALDQARGPVLDVGAGWGRLAPLYEEAGLQALYVEPALLGIRLMRRQGLGPLVCAKGERLPCASRTFLTTIIGWVLHHGSEGADAASILSEAARVSAPGGTLISVEPLYQGFTQQEWLGLITRAGFVVNDLHQFYERLSRRGRLELHMMAVCTRRPG